LGPMNEPRTPQVARKTVTASNARRERGAMFGSDLGDGLWIPDPKVGAEKQRRM
jgi:hypothetical protein